MNSVCRARLCDLAVGAQCIIQDIEGDTGTRARLCELGFVPGVRVRCVGVAPMADPRAYEVGGAVLALRAVDAAHLYTEALP